MDDLARADVSPEDDEFTVAQDTEFADDDLVLGDDDRPIDDGAAEELSGIDEERRVVLPDDPAGADEP